MSLVYFGLCATRALRAQGAPAVLSPAQVYRLAIAFDQRLDSLEQRAKGTRSVALFVELRSDSTVNRVSVRSSDAANDVGPRAMRSAFNERESTMSYAYTLTSPFRAPADPRGELVLVFGVLKSVSEARRR
jgi:hypothetical protein